MTPDCPYCGQPAKLVGGRQVYPHRADLASQRYFLCRPCDAFVGAHVHGGTLANAALRQARAAAHAAFDPIWKTRAMSQNAAYRWLAGELGIPKELCHISRFSLEQCRRVVAAVETRTPKAAE